MPKSPSRATARRRLVPPADPTVCLTCSVVPFGSLTLIGLLASVVCVLSVLVVLSSLIIHVQQSRLQRLLQPAPASVLP